MPFPSHPAGKYFAPLFLAQARARKVAYGNKSHAIYNYLVLVENGVYDDRDNGGLVGFSYYLDKYHYEATGLKHGANGC